MNFIEIDNDIINVDRISTIRKTVSKYDKNICTNTEIHMENGECVYCDSMYYMKLKEYIRPIKFVKDEKK